MEKWFVSMKKADFNGIAERYHVSPILARLIRNRDLMTDEEIGFYLNGTIADLYDGMLMRDMDKAVEILAEKIRGGEAIRVIGDYDLSLIHISKARFSIWQRHMCTWADCGYLFLSRPPAIPTCRGVNTSIYCSI